MQPPVSLESPSPTMRLKHIRLPSTAMPYYDMMHDDFSPTRCFYPADSSDGLALPKYTVQPSRLTSSQEPVRRRQDRIESPQPSFGGKKIMDLRPFDFFCKEPHHTRKLSPDPIKRRFPASRLSPTRGRMIRPSKPFTPKDPEKSITIRQVCFTQTFRPQTSPDRRRIFEIVLPMVKK
jgi:hypothetical protein